MTNALGDLASAALNILRGSTIEIVSFNEEPGEYDWLIQQFTPGRLLLRLLEFETGEGVLSDRSDYAGSILLRGISFAREFAEAVVFALESVLVEYGEDGYKKIWHAHPFPTATLADLRAELNM